MIKQTNIDVVDEQDNPTGETVSYNEVLDRGLWRRGVHAVIYTPDREIVMQKRAPSLNYHPNEVEISVGGGVDSGETPAQAMVREIKEELGVEVKAEDLRYLGKKKYNYPLKKQHSRLFIYSFCLCMPKGKLVMTGNPDETSAIFLLTEKKLRAALRRHRIRNVGKITSQYAYWKYLLDSIQG